VPFKAARPDRVTILFGHPGGNPNSHHAALAHFDAGWLEAFCVPWMPSQRSLRVIGAVPGLGSMARRLARRHFAPLDAAPKRQGRLGEVRRLLLRSLGQGSERLSYEANDWLMRTMTREARGEQITAVHSYEDCSLLQFEEARRRGKACIYDMPIGYYPAWQETEARLAKKYQDWLPQGGLPSSRYVRPEQKKAEMALADLVLAPSPFVERTIKQYCPDKIVAQAPYGVSLDFWRPGAERGASQPLTFIYAGQAAIRKGTPDLLDAWRLAELRDARLLMIGSWFLSDARRHDLPPNVTWNPPCAPRQLREWYRQADIFVMPSYFEGLSLALLEAMSCGLPVLASDVAAVRGISDGTAGRAIPPGDIEALVAALRWASDSRDALPAMGKAARAEAQQFTWGSYRRHVQEATAPFA
jgi:glycosyltransferase involved in cell wall biosynthesis